MNHDNFTENLQKEIKIKSMKTEQYYWLIAWMLNVFVSHSSFQISYHSVLLVKHILNVS